MQCSQCSYLMSGFDKECPRCHGKGAQQTASSSVPHTTSTPPQSQVAHILQKFLNEQQDAVIVEQTYNRVKEILTSGEEILYIAVQKKPLVNVSPGSAVLTDKRFIVYQPNLFGGAHFADYIWRDLRDARLTEGMAGSILTMQTVQGLLLTISYLPKAQARRLYSFAQQMEENVREERRSRDLEDKRAAAGGIVLQNGLPTVQSTSVPAQASSEDPMQKLKTLKQIFDSGLITAEEYDAKKGDILSKL